MAEHSEKCKMHEVYSQALSTHFVPGTKHTEFKEALTRGSSHSRSNQIHHGSRLSSKLVQQRMMLSSSFLVTLSKHLSRLTKLTSLRGLILLAALTLYLPSWFAARAPHGNTDDVTDGTTPGKPTSLKCQGTAKDFIYITHA